MLLTIGSLFEVIFVVEQIVVLVSLSDQYLFAF